MVLKFYPLWESKLEHYDEYKKVKQSKWKYQVLNEGIAGNRMSMGTIVGGADLKIKYLKGGYLGSIEEWFISNCSRAIPLRFRDIGIGVFKIWKFWSAIQSQKAKVPSWMRAYEFFGSPDKCLGNSL